MTKFMEITVPLCEAFAAIGIDITQEQLKTFERALYERGLNVAPRTTEQHEPQTDHRAAK